MSQQQQRFNEMSQLRDEPLDADSRQVSRQVESADIRQS
jgi:hypothetical protein